MSAMEELYRATKLKKGDELEPIPQILTAEAQDRLNELRATIVDPENQRYSITWRGKMQSLAQMLKCLDNERLTAGISGVQSNFRLVGHEKSLRQEADELDGVIPPPPPPPPPDWWLRVRKALSAAAKIVCVAILTALGTKFGGWLGGAIAAAIAGAFAVLLPIEVDAGASGHGE